jgi:hypothetical protein
MVTRTGLDVTFIGTLPVLRSIVHGTVCCAPGVYGRREVWEI